MRKQLLKGFTMLIGIMTIALVTAVASANGQSQTSKANIPFDFVVGDKCLPAGAYTVSSMTASGEALRIRNSDAKDSAIRMTVPLQGKPGHGKLVFHRYGQNYFLAEVWSDGTGEGRQLTKSKQERAIQKEFSRLASIKPAQRAFETVEIAATVR